MRSGEVLNGRYRLDERLGAGGFGVVWKAHDPQVQRAVAVKIGVPRSAREGLRMAREAKLNGNLPHPHIATVYDFGETDRDGERTLYLVMELIDGEPLSAILARELPPLDSALEWAAQICGALAAAHDAGVVHRDIKPANVMINRSGAVKVLDFGIAREQTGVTRLTSENTIIGSLPYMAPERWTNKDVDGRADLYALGCMLLELCTGRLPFRGEEWQEFCVQHTAAAPPVPSSLRPGLPAALDELVGELLAKDPAGRPGHAREVEQRLRAILAHAAAGTHRAAGRGQPHNREPETVGVRRAAARPQATPNPGGFSGEPYAPVAPHPRAPRLRRRRWLASAAAVGAVSAIAVAAWQFLPLGGGTGDVGAKGLTPGSTRSPATPGAQGGAGRSGTPTPSQTPSTPPSADPTPSRSPAARPKPRPPAPPTGSPARRTVAPKPPALPTGWFRLTNAASRMCLSVPDGSTKAAEGIVQAECGGGPEQFWQLTEEGRGSSGTVYSIRNGNSGLCLSVDAARKEEGVVVTQYLCGDEDGLFPDQYWTFRYDTTYRAWQLISRNSGKCVAVRDGGGNLEQALQLSCGSDAWLVWRT
ncbi:serine/threonine protein kinase [Streptomyces sannanensis]